LTFSTDAKFSTDEKTSQVETKVWNYKRSSAQWGNSSFIENILLNKLILQNIFQIRVNSWKFIQHCTLKESQKITILEIRNFSITQFNLANICSFVCFWFTKICLEYERKKKFRIFLHCETGFLDKKRKTCLKVKCTYTKRALSLITFFLILISCSPYLPLNILPNFSKMLNN